MKASFSLLESIGKAYKRQGYLGGAGVLEEVVGQSFPTRVPGAAG